MSRRLPVIALAAAALLAVGCEESLERGYGRRSGSEATSSVNGTAVLSEMFEQYGHDVSSWSWLSPTLRNRADVIVWLPDSFEAPKAESIDWLEEWLSEDRERCLIVVERDYDAAPDYWKQAIPLVPADVKQKAQRFLADQRADYLARRGQGTPTGSCSWYSYDRAFVSKKIKKLTGDPAWTTGVDLTKTDISLNSKFTPNDQAQPILVGDGEPLVSSYRPDEDGGRLILVANGSFLVNWQLVNHEHRRLAASLIAETGDPGNVVFLESGERGPRIVEDESKQELPHGLAALLVPPTIVATIHGLILACVFASSRLPIFGRARDPELTSQIISIRGQRTRVDVKRVEFAQHAQALGELMSKTKDVNYAEQQLKHFRQTVLRET